MLEALALSTLPAAPLVLAAGLLSLGALALLVWLWRDCGRRARDASRRSLLGSRASASRPALAWRLLLVGAFVLGLWGVPVVTEARSIAAADAATAGEGSGPASGDTRVNAGPAVPARGTRTALRLPFWHRATTMEETVAGRRLGGSVRDTLQIPWPFLLAVVLYGLTRPGRSPRAVGSALGSPRARRLLLLSGALGAGLLLGPGPRGAAARGCGGTDGPLCYTYTECRRILIIIEKCTTEYAYYPDYV